MYKIIDKNIIVVDGKQIILPFTIHKTIKEKIPYVLEFNNLIIVNFTPSGEEERLKAINNLEIYYRNVCAFDQLGNLIWKIERLPWIGGDSNGYSGIFIENNTLMAYNMVGIDVVVDPANGRVKTVGDGRPW